MSEVPSTTESLLVFRNSQGVETCGTLMSLSRLLVVFEVYNPYSVVQLSEVLHDLRIRRGDRTIYDGKAVVSNLVNTGLMLIVSATLLDPWSNLNELAPGPMMRAEVKDFVNDWQQGHQRLMPAYQNVVSSFRNFLEELNRWLGQGETVAGISEPTTPQPLVKAFIADVEDGVAGKLAELMGLFEERAASVSPDLLTVHKSFARRELHPLLLCSPFLYRTFTKPLGYAGDYEMVNMILRDPAEGQSVYAKLINTINLRTGAAAAHRNRIAMLVQCLDEETARAAATGRRLAVMNVACGPAAEIQRFARETPHADRCAFTLLDFNAETLAYARECIESSASQAGREQLAVTYVHKSIHDLLKEASGRRGAGEATYDIVYCAGLFDYLSDKICQRLLRLFAEWVRPGGMVLATNVHVSNPNRLYMEHILEWHLIYRSESDMRALAPPNLVPSVRADPTGFNIFLELRKPGPPQ